MIHTIGHGTLAQEDFLGLVRAAGMTEVVDIRSFPGSRHNPQYARQEMQRWLPESGVRYSWMRDLGGRRREVPESKHIALRHPSFRAYADYMETEPFEEAVDELVGLGEDRVVMCSESVWWRCHRRLLADHLVLIRGIEVLHLMHDGRVVAHPVTEGVRVEGGRLVYDGTVPAVPGQEEG